MNSKEIYEEDFICWVSEDPDDWNSFSDYERKLRPLVHEYNEEACCLCEPLLGIICNDPLNTIVSLSELHTDKMDNPGLRKRLEEIRLWAKLRMESCHPDNLDGDCYGNAAYQKGMSYWKAQEYEEAISCFMEAALDDNEKAYFMLGHVFENGFVGMKKDLERIVGYYQQGVENEVPFCEWRLGRLYLHGLIGPSDRKQAFYLIHKAALHGSGAAAKELPDLYRKGVGCEASPAKADYWKHVGKVLSGNEDNNLWMSRCVETGLLELYLTAGQIHFMAMNDSEYWWDECLNQWRTRIKPTEEQAKDYVDSVKSLLSYYSGYYPKGVSPIDDKEAPLMEEKVKAYEKMHLDMRDVLTLDENFHFSLRRITGEVLVPSLYWPTERYDYIDIIRESWGAVWCVPIREHDKYALCKMDGKRTLVTGFDYDHIYRYFGGRISTFVVEKDGKKGLISQSGEIIIPCEVDEIYELIDADGIVPFKKGDKWGMAFVGNQLPTSVNATSKVGVISSK
jgi:hypothetical protein